MADNGGSTSDDDGSTTPAPGGGWTARLESGLRWFLLLYGCALGSVATLDLFMGDDLGVRMDGAGLGCAALIVVAGCAVARSVRGARRPFVLLVLAADGAALLASLSLLSRIQSNFVPQARLTTVLAIVSVATVVAGTLAFVDFGRARHPVAPPPGADDPTTDRHSQTRGAVLGATATLLAASLALPQFWYSARYQPSSVAPALSVDNEITQVRNDKGKLEITVAITVENSGDTPLSILISKYEITGTHVDVNDSPRPGDLKMEEGIRSKNYGPIARYNTYSTYAQPQQIQVGSIAWDHAWLGPDEKNRVTLLAHATQGDANLLRITTDVAVARADRVESVQSQPDESFKPIPCDGITVVRDRQAIVHPGVLDWLTESDRELVTTWAIAGDDRYADKWWPPFPQIRASIQHVGHTCEHALEGDDEGLEDRAMLGWAGAIAEAGIPEP